MPMTIQLTNPITTHDGEKREITLRDPVGSDFVKLKKLPLTLTVNKDGSYTPSVDYELAIRWLSALSGIDDILLGKMARKDFMAAVSGLNDHLRDEGDEPGNSP